MKTKTFFDDIERLRGIACILVLIQHIAWICPLRFTYNIVPFHLLVGSGAVHIFFAISGFVVTLSLKDKLQFSADSLFMDRFNSSRSWLFSFYKKRAFRILPVLMFVLLCLTVFLACTNPDYNWLLQISRCPIEILSGVYQYSVQYFDVTEKLHFGGTGPFWTLAVEAQFYMLWPIILLMCKTDNARMLLSFSLGALFLFVIEPAMILTYGYKYYAIYSNVSELFFGAFFAYVYDSKLVSKAGKTAITIGILLVMTIWYYPNSLSSDYFYTHTVISIASIFAVVLAVFYNGSYNIPVLGKVFDKLGKISYSFYAVQLTLANIIVWFTNSLYFPKSSLSEYDFYMLQLIIFMVALIAVSYLTYRFIEKPCRKLGQ